MGEPASQNDQNDGRERIWNVDEKHLQNGESSYLQGTFKTFPYCQTVPYREFFCDAFRTKGQIFTNLETPHGQILCKYTTVTL